MALAFQSGHLLPPSPPVWPFMPPETAVPSTPPPPSPPRELFNLWYVGVFIMSIGTLCQAIGANLQRLSANREAALPPEHRQPARKRPLFVSGVVLMVGAGIVSATALIFSAQSLLAPLILLIFVANPVCAWIINKEPFNWRTDGLCTALVIASVAVVVAFAPQHSASYTAEHMKWLFKQCGRVRIEPCACARISYGPHSYVVRDGNRDMGMAPHMRRISPYHGRSTSLLACRHAQCHHHSPFPSCCTSPPPQAILVCLHLFDRRHHPCRLPD